MIKRPIRGRLLKEVKATVGAVKEDRPTPTTDCQIRWVIFEILLRLGLLTLRHGLDGGCKREQNEDNKGKIPFPEPLQVLVSSTNDWLASPMSGQPTFVWSPNSPVQRRRAAPSAATDC